MLAAAVRPSLGWSTVSGRRKRSAAKPAPPGPVCRAIALLQIVGGTLPREWSSLSHLRSL